MATSSPDKAPKTSFRDSLATIDKRGRRLWVYPNKPSGPFHRARVIVAVGLISFLFGAPFIKIHGNPLLQFDILNRKFYIFGQVFWPQDFHLFVLGVITFAIFVLLFTAAFGRLFCGWVCPQTIFLEMVFRKIEFLIDGNGPRQRELARAPWSLNKLFRRVLKHGIFFGISFLIGNTFLAYIIGKDELFHIMSQPPSEHLTGFIAMLIFSSIFYFVFAWFREQACTLVCPYGRLQSVLLDNNSIVVAYDFKRGEPRGPVHRGEERSDKGDCIDCFACVKVCPTGIDIRNGTQLECVNCTACIDACNRVMDRMKLPRGLIRYSSYNGIQHGQKFKITPRLALYIGVLTLLLGVMSVLAFLRHDIETTVLRAPGSLYEVLDNGNVRNLYTIRVVNKTEKDMPIELKLENTEGTLKIVGSSLRLKAQESLESVFFVEIPKNNLYSPNSILTIDVYSGDKKLETVHTTFTGPKPEQ